MTKDEFAAVLQGAVAGNHDDLERLLGLYKPLTSALRKTKLLPTTQSTASGTKPGTYIFAAFLLITCILFLLVLQNKI